MEIPGCLLSVDLSVQELKEQLRQQVRLRLRGISAQARKEASESACSLLTRQEVWKRASSVLFYAPTAGELDLWPLLEQAIEAGKIVALPRFDARKDSYNPCRISDLHREICLGEYQIREPLQSCTQVSLNQLDLILVPGVAFELHGRRLGRGKGYYDRLLAAVRGKTCGVAFDEQIVKHIPVEPHDSDVNCILTPTRWIEL